MYILANIAVIALLVWAALVYNKKRKERWERLRAYKNVLDEVHAANLRYFLDVYCGRKSELDKLTHRPIPLN